MTSTAILILVAATAAALLSRPRKSEAFEEDSTGLSSDLMRRTLKLIRYMQQKYPNDPRTKRLDQRWKREIHALHHRHLQAGKTVNKSLVYICLKDSRGRVNDANTAFFVLLHELAHVVNETIGHDENFWNNMRFLLDAAIKSGAYKYEDYSLQPRTYCGQRIGGNPYDCVLKGACKAL
jgi:hypothetical protein